MVKIILKKIEIVELLFFLARVETFLKTGKKLNLLCFSWGGLETPFACMKTKTL